MSQDDKQTNRSAPEGNPNQNGAASPTLKALVREKNTEFYDISTLLQCLSLGISGLEVRDVDADPLTCLAELCIELAELVSEDREEMRQKWCTLKEVHEDLLRRTEVKALARQMVAENAPDDKPGATKH